MISTRRIWKTCIPILMIAIRPNTAKYPSMAKRVPCAPAITIIHYETDTRLELLYFILAAYGMSFILVYGSIFDSIRPARESLRGLGRFFHCILCMGFHSGVFLFFISPFTELFNFSFTLANLFICGCIAAGTSYLLGMLVNDSGLNLSRKGEDK